MLCQVAHVRMMKLLQAVGAFEVICSSVHWNKQPFHQQMHPQCTLSTQLEHCAPTAKLNFLFLNDLQSRFHFQNVEKWFKALGQRKEIA